MAKRRVCQVHAQCPWISRLLQPSIPNEGRPIGKHDSRSAKDAAGNTEHGGQIGEFAFPKLISETLTAQNAKIDAVSGASYTSAGYVRSLQSALDKRT